MKCAQLLLNVHNSFETHTTLVRRREKLLINDYIQIEIDNFRIPSIFVFLLQPFPPLAFPNQWHWFEGQGRGFDWERRWTYEGRCLRCVVDCVNNMWNKISQVAFSFGLAIAWLWHFLFYMLRCSPTLDVPGGVYQTDRHGGHVGPWSCPRILQTGGVGEVKI